MPNENQTHQEFAVARGEAIIGTFVRESWAAEERLSAAEKQMRELGLEPDLRLVEVDVTVTTKRSRPRAYKPAEPATDDAPVTLPASGIWGDDGTA